MLFFLVSEGRARTQLTHWQEKLSRSCFVSLSDLQWLIKSKLKGGFERWRRRSKALTLAVVVRAWFMCLTSVTREKFSFFFASGIRAELEHLKAENFFDALKTESTPASEFSENLLVHADLNDFFFLFNSLWLRRVERFTTIQCEYFSFVPRIHLLNNLQSFCLWWKLMMFIQKPRKRKRWENVKLFAMLRRKVPAGTSFKGD